MGRDWNLWKSPWWLYNKALINQLFVPYITYLDLSYCTFHSVPKLVNKTLSHDDHMKPKMCTLNWQGNADWSELTNWVRGPYQEIQTQIFPYRPNLRGLSGKSRACIFWYSTSTQSVNSSLDDPMIHFSLITESMQT